MSYFKKYGGTKNLEKTNNITVNSLVADSITLKNSYFGTFNVDGTLSVTGNVQFGGNMIVENDLYFLGDLVNIEKDLEIQGNVGIESSLHVTEQIYLGENKTDLFLFGVDNNGIGIGTTNPTATLDIQGTQSTSFAVKSSQNATKNILVQNSTQQGILLSGNTTSSAVEFFNNTPMTITAIPDASIQYSNGNLITDVVNSQILHSQVIMNKRKYHADTPSSSGETCTIYDTNDVPFFPNVYETSGTTACSLAMISKTEATNTTSMWKTPEGNGFVIGGGIFPETSRVMGFQTLINNEDYFSHAPCEMILSGTTHQNPFTKGINTFTPATESYIFDVNGPMRLHNGSIQHLITSDFEIKVSQILLTSIGIAVGVKTTSVTPFVKKMLKTEDSGITWEEKEINFFPDLSSFSFSLTSIFLCDDTYGFMGGTTHYLFYTCDGGDTWINFSTGTLNVGSLDIESICVLPLSSTQIRLVIAYEEKVEFMDILLSQLDGTTTNPTLTNKSTLSFPGVAIKSIHGFTTTTTGIFYAVGEDTIYTKIFLDPEITSAISTVSGCSYQSVMVLNLFIAAAVGINCISVTFDGGINWTHHATMGKNWRKVHLLNSMNGIVVGDNGAMYYSKDGLLTWETIPEIMLNSSGNATTLTSLDLKTIGFQDSTFSTLIVMGTVVGTNTSQVHQVYLPNLFNYATNTIMDMSGNFNLSGQLNIQHYGAIQTNKNTFELFTTTVSSLYMGNSCTNLYLGLNGNTHLNDLYVVGNSFFHDLEVTGNLSTTGNAVISGNLIVTGPSFLNATVTTKDVDVVGNVTSSGNVEIGGNLVVTGPTFLNATATTKDMNVVGNLSTTGNVEIGGNLVVTGPTFLNATATTKDMNVVGNLSTTGNVEIDVNLVVTGPTFLNATTTTKDVDVVGNLSTTGNVEIGGNLVVGGPTFLNATATTKDVDVVGNVTSSGNVEMDGNLVVGGPTFLNATATTKDMDVVGNVTTTGNITINNQLNVTGNIITSTYCMASNYISLSNNRIVMETQSTGGNILMTAHGGNIVIGSEGDKVSILGGQLISAEATISGNADIWGNTNTVDLNVTQNSIFSGPMTTSNITTIGNIDLTGNMILSNHLYQSGSGTIIQTGTGVNSFKNCLVSGTLTATTLTTANLNTTGDIFFNTGSAILPYATLTPDPGLKLFWNRADMGNGEIDYLCQAQGGQGGHCFMSMNNSRSAYVNMFLYSQGAVFSAINLRQKYYFLRQLLGFNFESGTANSSMGGDVYLNAVPYGKYDGVVVGSCVVNANAKFGNYSMESNASSTLTKYIDLPNITLNTLSDGISFSFWLKPWVVALNTTFVYFQFDQYIKFARDYVSGTNTNTFYYGSGASKVNVTIALDTYQHIIITHNAAGGVKIYVNFVEMATGDVIYTIKTSLTDGRLGAPMGEYSTGVRSMAGSMDSFEMFNKVLNANDVSTFNDAATSYDEYHLIFKQKNASYDNRIRSIGGNIFYEGKGSLQVDTSLLQVNGNFIVSNGNATFGNLNTTGNLISSGGLIVSSGNTTLGNVTAGNVTFGNLVMNGNINMTSNSLLFTTGNIIQTGVGTNEFKNSNFTTLSASSSITANGSLIIPSGKQITLQSGSSGIVTNGLTVTPEQLGFLNGATSNLQQQLSYRGNINTTNTWALAQSFTSIPSCSVTPTLSAHLVNKSTMDTALASKANSFAPFFGDCIQINHATGPFIDFNTINGDYDVRLMASGGSAIESSKGTGLLTLNATAGFTVDGIITAPSISVTGSATITGNVSTGNVTLTSGKKIQFASEAGQKLNFWNNGSNNTWSYYGVAIADATLRYNVDTPGASHIFSCGNAGATAYTDLARINSTGLGIGVSPAFKLHVAGTTYLDGATTITGNLHTSGTIRIEPSGAMPVARSDANGDFGLRIFWNDSPDDGETDYLCLGQGSSGGHCFITGGASRSVSKSVYMTTSAMIFWSHNMRQNYKYLCQVLVYDFEGSANSLFGTYHGTVVGGAVVASGAKFGSYSLTSNNSATLTQYVNIPTVTLSTWSNGMTFAFWLNPAVVTSDSTCVYFNFSPTGDKIKLSRDTSSSGAVNTFYYGSGVETVSFSLTIGSYQHIAITHDSQQYWGVNVRIYVNFTQVATGNVTYPTDLVSSTLSGRLGAPLTQANNIRSMAGNMDSFEMFNKPFRANDVLTLNPDSLNTNDEYHLIFRQKNSNYDNRIRSLGGNIFTAGQGSLQVDTTLIQINGNLITTGNLTANSNLIVTGGANITGNSTLGNVILTANKNITLSGTSIITQSGTGTNTLLDLGVGNVTLAQGKKLSFYSGEGQKINLWQGGSAWGYYGFAIENATMRYNVDSPAATHLFSSGNAGGTGFTDLMRLTSTGLGINTTPAYKLHVVGTTYLNGDTTITGNSTLGNVILTANKNITLSGTSIITQSGTGTNTFKASTFSDLITANGNITLGTAKKITLGLNSNIVTNSGVIITDTEISYLDGLTGSIQSQLNYRGNTSTTNTWSALNTFSSGLYTSGTVHFDAASFSLPTTLNADAGVKLFWNKSDIGAGEVNYLACGQGGYGGHCFLIANYENAPTVNMELTPASAHFSSNYMRQHKGILKQMIRYTFEGGNASNSAIGEYYHGTVVNNAIANSDAKLGSYSLKSNFETNSTDYVSIPTLTLGTLSEGISFAFWVKFKENTYFWYSGHNNPSTFVNFEFSQGIIFSRNINLDMFNIELTTDVMNYCGITVPITNPTVYRHVTITHASSGAVKIYVNYVQVASGTATYLSNATITAGKLGAPLTSTSFYSMEGNMDQFEMFNKVLTLKEIQTFNDGDTGSDVYYLNFRQKNSSYDNRIRSLGGNVYNSGQGTMQVDTTLLQVNGKLSATGGCKFAGSPGAYLYPETGVYNKFLTIFHSIADYGSWFSKTVTYSSTGTIAVGAIYSTTFDTFSHHDTDKRYLVMPGYRLVVNDGGNYGGSVTLDFTNTQTFPVLCTPTNNMGSSCYLYYNGVEIV